MSRNRYVGDYRLVESIDGRGHIRTDYEYIGAAYTYAEGAAAAARQLRWAMACCAVGWAAFAGAMIPVSAAMRTLYVSLPFAFAALPLGLMTGVLLGALRAREPLEHRHADRLENRGPACSFFVMLLSGISLAGEGVGLIRGLDVARPVNDIVNDALKAGLIIISAKGNTLRFVPPLIIEKAQVDEMIGILEKIL